METQKTSNNKNNLGKKDKSKYYGTGTKTET